MMKSKADIAGFRKFAQNMYNRITGHRPNTDSSRDGHRLNAQGRQQVQQQIFNIDNALRNSSLSVVAARQMINDIQNGVNDGYNNFLAEQQRQRNQQAHQVVSDSQREVVLKHKEREARLQKFADNTRSDKKKINYDKPSDIIQQVNIIRDTAHKIAGYVPGDLNKELTEITRKAGNGNYNVSLMRDQIEILRRRFKIT